jgi:hypothetical protein
MATIKKPKIQPLNAHQKALLADVRAAKAAGASVASAAFKRMSRQAQASSLRAHS